MKPLAVFLTEHYGTDILTGKRFLYRERGDKVAFFTNAALDDLDLDVFPYLVVSSQDEIKYSYADLVNEHYYPLYWGLVFDLDLPKNIKDQIRSGEIPKNEADVFRSWFVRQYHNKVEEILSNANLIDWRIVWIPSKSFLHLAVVFPYPTPYPPEIYKEEHSRFRSALVNVFPDWVVVEEWRINDFRSKATYNRIFDYDLENGYSRIFELIEDSQEIETTSTQEIEKKMLPRWIKAFQNRELEPYGGGHNAFILFWAGEMAKAGFSMEETIQMYETYFQAYDNPQDVKSRIATIKKTYEKFQNGEPVKSLAEFPHLRLPRRIKKRENKEMIKKIQKVARKKRQNYLIWDGDKVIKIYGNRGKPRVKVSNICILSIAPTEIEYEYKITFRHKQTKGTYETVVPIPNTKTNSSKADEILARYPVSKHEVRDLLGYIQTVYEFPELSSKTKTPYEPTGWLDAYHLMKISPQYALLVGLNLIKYQVPHLKNLVLWVKGKTGIGKSSVLEKLSYDFNVSVMGMATTVGLERVGVLNPQRPVILDDTALIKPEILKDAIFTYHLGVGKARGTKAGRVDVGNIKSNLVVASELSPDVVFEDESLGTLRRIVVIELSAIPHIRDYINEYAKGWADYFPEIPSKNVKTDIEGYFREYINYLAGFEEMLGRMGIYHNLRELIKPIQIKRTEDERLYYALIEFLSTKKTFITVEGVYLSVAYIKDVAKMSGIDKNDLVRTLSPYIETIQWQGIKMPVINVRKMLNDLGEIILQRLETTSTQEIETTPTQEAKTSPEITQEAETTSPAVATATKTETTLPEKVYKRVSDKKAIIFDVEVEDSVQNLDSAKKVIALWLAERPTEHIENYIQQLKEHLKQKGISEPVSWGVIYRFMYFFLPEMEGKR